MTFASRNEQSPPLCVLHVLLSLEPGGTERLVVDIANGLSATGVGVHVCCLDGLGPLEDHLDGRVTTHLLRRPARFAPHFAWRLARLARRLGAQVLHCHQYTPFVYGCMSRLFAPSLGLVFTEHGRLAGAVPSRKRRLVNGLITKIGGEQFAVSHELRSFMLLEGFSGHRLRVLHNGIDTRPAPLPRDRTIARQHLGVPPDAFVVGTTARFDPVKDLGTLVHAVAAVQRRLPSTRLVLIGDGPCRDDIVRAAAALNLTGLTLTGYRSDARALLPAFDVYVNCSTSEGISVAILEAMDAGLPVIATSVGGTPEIIRQDVDGWLVAPEAPEALADALVTLGMHPELGGSRGANGRRRISESFSAGAMIAGYTAAYHRATGTADQGETNATLA